MSEAEDDGASSADAVRAIVSAGEYLNKMTGERVERECRERLRDGCKELVVDFSGTELANSIGVSILLGVIDSAQGEGAKVVLSGVNADTAELFEMLGVTRHAELVS